MFAVDGVKRFFLCARKSSQGTGFAIAVVVFVFEGKRGWTERIRFFDTTRVETIVPRYGNPVAVHWDYDITYNNRVRHGLLWESDARVAEAMIG